MPWVVCCLLLLLLLLVFWLWCADNPQCGTWAPVYLFVCLLALLLVSRKVRCVKGQASREREKGKRRRGQGSGQRAWDTRHRFFTWISFALLATSCCAFAQRFFPFPVANRESQLWLWLSLWLWSCPLQERAAAVCVKRFWHVPANITNTYTCVYECTIYICVCVGYWLAHFF